MMASSICQWHMARVFISIQRALLIKGNGNLISSMVEVLRSGRMVVNTQESFMKDSNKVLERNYGLVMEPHIRANGFRIRCMDLVSISGLMVDSIQDIGIRTIWKE